MSFTWGLATLGMPPADGGVQVDSLGVVWQWSGSASAWMKKPELVFEEINSVRLPIGSWPTNMNVFKRRAGRVGAQWDTVYAKTFVQVDAVDTSTTYGRIAHVSLAELLAWLPTIVPVAAGRWFNVPIFLRIFRVVDTSLRPGRIQCWNHIYGALRGRKSYRQGTDRENAGLDRYDGADPKYYTWAGPSLAKALIQRTTFYATAPENPKCVWFPSSKRNLYRLPRTRTTPDTPMPAKHYHPNPMGRMCWNSTTHTYQLIDVGSTWVVAPTTVKVLFLGRKSAETVPTVQDLSETRGSRFINLEMDGCIVYHLVDDINANLHAYYVKPIGLTHMALETNLAWADWELMAVSHYKGESAATRQVSVPVEDRQAVGGGGAPGGQIPGGGWRWRIHKCVPYQAKPNSIMGLPFHPQSWCSEVDTVPTSISFYLRNRTTGVCSPPLSSTVDIVRRRNNINLAFMERRG